LHSGEIKCAGKVKKGETARFRQIWRIINSVYWLSSLNFVKKKNWSIIDSILTLQSNETIGGPDTLIRKGKTAEKLKDIKDKKRLRV
jgi:hypothetical protein